MYRYIISALMFLVINNSSFGGEIVSSKPHILRISTPRPYNEIAVDSIFENIINCERDMAYVYGTDDVTELSGLCLRAYTVWAQRLTGNDLLRVKVLCPFQTFRNPSPISLWAYEYDDDKEDENGNFLTDRELIRANEYIDEVPFEVVNYSEYCNLDKLLVPNVSLVKISTFFGLFSSMVVKLSVLIPDSNKNQWIYRDLMFVFRLKADVDIELWNNHLKRALDSDPYYLVGSDNFVNLYNLLMDFSWELYEVSISKEKIYDAPDKNFLNSFLTSANGL